MTTELARVMEAEQAEQAANIGDIVKALGQTKEAEKEINKHLFDTFKLKGGASKIQENLRAQVRQHLGLEEEDEFSFEGWTAALGTEPDALYIDPSAEVLTAEVVMAALKGGYLVLNVGLYKQHLKDAPTGLFEKFKKAVFTGKGTRPLSVGRTT